MKIERNYFPSRSIDDIINFIKDLQSIFTYSNILAMKLTLILTVIAVLNSSASSFGQNVTLNVNKGRLETVLNEIQKQTGYSLLVNSNHLKNSKPVTIKVDNEKFTKVLDAIFEKQAMMYLISDKIITVTQIPPTQAPKETVEQQTISGYVVDENNKPMAGVTIKELGRSNQTKTDASGFFTINTSSTRSVLQFNYLGYQTLEKAAVENMAVQLKPKDQNIDEVVITGFQKINKEKFTGSVSTVDKALIDRSGYVDVSKMLQGAAAGVSVQNVSGTMGTSAKIRIRGNASISANQEPLYVVNGIPITSPSGVSVNQLYSGDVTAVLGSAIAGLNAQDIEDIVILKDGAATSLYGTRAANGVISITTKTGKAEQTTINYTTGLSYGIKPNIKNHNLMTSKEEMAMYRRLWNAGYYSDANWPSQTGPYTEAYRQYALRNADITDASSIQNIDWYDVLNNSYADLERATLNNTDWFDVLFRNNLVQEHNLSFSGGNSKNTYYVSGNYSTDNGQAAGFNFNRYTIDFRDVIKVGSRISLDLNANYAYRQQNTPGVLNSGTSYGAVTRSFELNPTMYAINTSRAMYPYNADGSLKYYLNNFAEFNILKELSENFADINAQEFRIMVRPTVKVTDNLTYEFTGSLRRTYNIYNHTATELSNYANAHRVDDNEALRDANGLLWLNPNDPKAVKATILPDGGILIARSNTGMNYNIRNQFTFDKRWENHSLNSLVGAEIRSDYINRQYNKNYGYLYYSGKTTNPSVLAYMKSVLTDDKLYIESFQRENVVGFYTAHQYSFMNRYNLEVGARFDGSNMFGRNVRSKFLPNYSFGTSWNVDKEGFFQDANIKNTITFLKLRASYALRGNTFQTSPQLNAAPVNLNKIDVINSETGIAITSPELYSLNWERDYVSNFGLDIGLFDRVNLTVEYYSRKNRDLITDFNTALEEGFSTKKVNWATMTNKGVDISLGFNNILNSVFKWDINLVYGYVKNRIVEGELQSLNLTTITRPQGYGLEGHPLEGLYAYRFAHLNSFGRPVFYKGDQLFNEIGSTERDRSLIEYVGSRAPTSTGSFATNFGYKGFDLRFFLTFAAGHRVFKDEIAFRSYTDATSKSGDLNYMWQTAGNEYITNIPGLISRTQQSYLSTKSNIDEVAYNRSTERVVDASHVRLSEIMLSYDLINVLGNYKAFRSSRIAFSANNITFWGSQRLRGVDPDVYITGINLPNPRTYSLRLSFGF